MPYQVMLLSPKKFILIVYSAMRIEHVEKWLKAKMRYRNGRHWVQETSRPAILPGVNRDPSKKRKGRWKWRHRNVHV